MRLLIVYFLFCEYLLFMTFIVCVCFFCGVGIFVIFFMTGFRSLDCFLVMFWAFEFMGFKARGVVVFRFFVSGFIGRGFV